MRHEVRGRPVKRRIAVAVVAGIGALLTVTSASAVPNAANVQVIMLVGTGPITERPPEDLPMAEPRTFPL